MLQRLHGFLRVHKDILLYIIFGALTTFVNFLVYFPLYNFTSFSAFLCNVIAWCISVCFAFFTNKPLVFQSKDWTMKIVIPEFLKFIGCRFMSGAIESLIIWITVDMFNWNGNYWKIITGVVVVILNYIGSKFLVFRNRR